MVFWGEMPRFHVPKTFTKPMWWICTAELGDKLDLYIKYRLPPLVKLVRLKERHGLIRARLEGAKASIGDVLIFLDSHCEANDKWWVLLVCVLLGLYRLVAYNIIIYLFVNLYIPYPIIYRMEPLLQRIKESRSAVLVPIIDVIDDNTLEYYHGNGRYFQVRMGEGLEWVVIGHWEEVDWRFADWLAVSTVITMWVQFYNLHHYPISLFIYFFSRGEFINIYHLTFVQYLYYW